MAPAGAVVPSGRDALPCASVSPPGQPPQPMWKRAWRPCCGSLQRIAEKKLPCQILAGQFLLMFIPFSKEKSNHAISVSSQAGVWERFRFRFGGMGADYTLLPDALLFVRRVIDQGALVISLSI